MTQPHHTTIAPDLYADLDGEDLACMGMCRARFWNSFWNQYLDLLEPDPGADPAVIARWDEVVRACDEAGIAPGNVRGAQIQVITPKPKSRKARRVSIKRAIAAAEKAGKTVTAITTPDGVTLSFGGPSADSETNPWDKAIQNATQSKRPS